ncbi:MAG: DNA polymerase IV, partial [Caldilineaceae bacterium]
MNALPTTARKILHLDLDAFFCAVEEQRDPALRGRPFAVGGQPEERGVVASCSYPARAFGIHSAMPMSQAVRHCPDLIIVPARHRAYGRVSKEVMTRLRTLTALVEQLSIDEAFLDVTALPESAELIARRLQLQIQTELGLSSSLGVAANKLVAKIANNVGKAAARTGNYPHAITIVPPGREAEFLAPLPCGELWGVGPKTAERLQSLGITTIGEIAAWPEKELTARFGKHGSDLARHAKGIDLRAVETARETKSISQETTFTRDVRDREKLRQTIQEQAAAVAGDLRRKRLTATTVKLKLRWSDFTTITRQTSFEQPTDAAQLISTAALRLFEQEWNGQLVRLIGVGVSGLGNSARQLSFWEDPTDQSAREKEERLHQALQALRQRFGDSAIQRG